MINARWYKKMPPKVKKNSTEKLLQIRGKLAKLLKLEEAVALKYGVKIYCIALLLSADQDEWQLFCEHEDWGNRKQKPQPKPESQKDALNFAIKFTTAIGLDSTASWGRKLNDLLRGAWNQKLQSTEIKAHVKAIQKAKRAKAAETRDKRRENSPRSITLNASEFSKPLLATTGEHRIKAEVKVSVRQGQKPVFEIAGLGKKALKLFGIAKPEKPKPVKKPALSGK